MDPSTRQFFARLKSADARNAVCCDCGAPNPQWASVKLASFFCLECSGQHRSVGSHITFVRSITMDTWTKVQLQRMELGGNTRLQDFYAKYGYPDLKAESISTIYSNAVGDAYRAKLDALVAGKPYTDPEPDALKGRRAVYGSSSGGGGLGSSGSRSTASSNNWGGSAGLSRSSGSPSPAPLGDSTTAVAGDVSWGFDDDDETDDWFDTEEPSFPEPSASAPPAVARNGGQAQRARGARGRGGRGRGGRGGQQRQQQQQRAGQFHGSKIGGFQGSEVGAAQSNSKYKGLSSDSYFGGGASGPAQSNNSYSGGAGQRNETDELSEAFSQGWSKLTNVTKATGAFLATKATEVTEKAQDTDWNETAEKTKAAAAAAASSGWGFVQSAWSSVVGEEEGGANDQQQQDDAFDAFVGPSDPAPAAAAPVTRTASPPPAAQPVSPQNEEASLASFVPDAAGSSGGADNWDDWGDEPKKPADVRTGTPSPAAPKASPAPVVQADATLSGWDEDW